MFPTLGHLFNSLFGTDIIFPLPTYGFMLAMAFFVGFLVVRHELKRKEKLGLIPVTTRKVLKGKPASTSELITSMFFGFIIGFKIIGIIVSYDVFVKDVQGYILSLQGNIIGGVFTAGLFAAVNWWTLHKKRLDEPVEEEEEVRPHQLTVNILLIAAVSGIIGAKIFHQLENFDQFLRDPVGSLFSAGGLTFYGGLIFGVLAVLWYIKKKKIPWIHMLDVAAPAVMIAYAVGRIGCMTSGDGCWGIENTTPKPEWLAFLPDWMWAFDFPHNVINQGVEIPGCEVHGGYCRVLEQPVFPTPFYETTICTIFFGVLWFLRKRIAVHGLLFSIFLMMNGVERFFIEKIRVNTNYIIGGVEITQAEIISVVLFLIGVVTAFLFIKRHRKKKSEKENNVAV